VVISGSNIIDLSGINVVTSIEGDLTIDVNPALTNLTGLEGLTSIGGSLIIGEMYYGGNLSLVSLAGLDNLDSIGGSLHIFYNNALTSLTGLDALTTIGGELHINGNNALTSLTGLDNLTFVGGGLTIDGNPALTSLTGLQALDSINGSLIIGYPQWGAGGNVALTSLIGLEGLTSIKGGLEIFGNAALTNLYGLKNIDANSITNLSIHDNYSLSTCDVKSVCDYLTIQNGPIDISENATGCDSVVEVAKACGIYSIEDIIEDELFSIYPNPFTDHLTIDISLDQPDKVYLEILNSMGQVIATILDELLLQGRHQFTWNAEGLTSGIYFYQLRAEGIGQVGAGKIVKY